MKNDKETYILGVDLLSLVARFKIRTLALAVIRVFCCCCFVLFFVVVVFLLYSIYIFLFYFFRCIVMGGLYSARVSTIQK